jgi:glycosyltransferase involved in cell wall biosynthesis
MIVKNEENVIARCLNSVKDIVDEIIIVDTGSTDNTKKIVSEFTDKIYDFQWIDNFSAARNFSYSKAAMDYILWLDADDIILSKDKEKFISMKQSLLPAIDMVMMKYDVAFDEHGAVTLSYFRERLSKRINNYKWNEPVHEYLQISGIVINSEIHITHQKQHPSLPERNLLIYEKMISSGTGLTPRGLFYYARELSDCKRYDDAIKYYNKFLDTNDGYQEDNIRACSDLAICYHIKHDLDNMWKILLRSFEYDSPRAEICCHLGFYYLDKEEYDKAIVWYKIALQLEKPAEGWGFILHDYWGFIPNLQLSVCYDRLGNLDEAIKYNDNAAKFKPENSQVIFNKLYFKECKELIK